jgi:hypothetical protein
MFFSLETKTLQVYGRMIAVEEKVLRHYRQTIMFTFLWIFQIAKFVIMSARGTSLYWIFDSKTQTSHYSSYPEYAVYPPLLTGLEFGRKSRISSMIYFLVVKSNNFSSSNIQISSSYRLLVIGSFGEKT